jgi:dTDP-glucose pyrophosphorylase
VLCKKGVIEYFDLILSNEDVNQSKPHPEIYWRAMSLLEAHPSETLIVEDSPAGLAAAHAAGTAILQIKKPKDLSLNRILNYCEISQRITQKPKWRDEKLNIVIPMGGAGRRFAEKGYTFPKPLIEVEGRPMIQLVIENLQLAGRFIFIVDEQTLTQYNLQAVLQLLAPGCIVIPETGPRRGAAYATLLAEQYIDNDQPLIIANCDQLVEWDPLQFMYKAQEQNVDGSILTFESVHPKWSYARTNELGIVQEVAEKNPISNQATVGIYLWSKGSDYLRCLRQMIDKDIKVNGEFYVCPVFNEGIAEGLKFSTYHVDVMLGLGTPEDLETYLARNR